MDFSPAEEAELGKGKSKSNRTESETKTSGKEEHGVSDDEDVLIDRSTTDNDRSSSLVRAPKENEKSRVEEYCSKYQENYAYYCQGNSERSPNLRQQLYKFCPSYELNCPKETSEVYGTAILAKRVTPILQDQRLRESRNNTETEAIDGFRH